MSGKTFLASLLFCCCAFFSTAQTPIGTWKTIDDKTNQPKSHIEIYEKGGKLYGKVVKFLRANADPNRRCTDCSGSKKNQLIMGMNVLENMELKDGMWKNGVITDPENGKEYSCRMWLKQGNPNELVVRGFLGISLLGRSQTWYRVQ